MARIRWLGAQIRWMVALGAMSGFGVLGPARVVACGAPCLGSQFFPASVSLGSIPPSSARWLLLACLGEPRAMMQWCCSTSSAMRFRCSVMSRQGWHVAMVLLKLRLSRGNECNGSWWLFEGDGTVSS